MAVNAPPTGVTVHHIKDYLAMLQEDHRYRPTTLSRVIATLRVFFEFGVRQGLLESSPAQTLHNPKLPRRLPIYLVESELQRLLSAPNPDDASPCATTPF